MNEFLNQNKSLLYEFKKFLTRRNVIDLAVAVIMGAAFMGIIQSFVRDILAPILGIFLGGINFTNLSLTFGNASIQYGSFFQAIINFLIIGFFIFLLVKIINKVQERLLAQEKEEIIVTPEVKLLQEIRDLLKNK
jgi:large conductance mechanosensitive channel